MNKKRAIELLKCLPLRTDISLGEDALEAIRYICAEQEIFNSARVVTYEEWKEVIRKEPLTIKSTKKVEGLTFVELDESSVGTLATSIIDKIMKAKPPTLPADVEGKMKEILKYVRQAGNPHDEVVAESLYNLTEKQIMEYGLAQLLALYPQMASENPPTKVFQTKFGKDGNCFSACLATLLKMKIEDIPNFQEENGEWYFNYKNWLKGKGWDLVAIKFNEDRADEDKFIPQVYHITSGTSPRGLAHSTIYFGKTLYHDPHPEGGDVKDITERIFIIPTSPNISYIGKFAKPALTEEELEKILPPEKDLSRPLLKENKEYNDGYEHGFNEALSLCKQAILKWQRGER